MKAVRYHEYGDPSVLGVDEVARPEPGDGEVLVEIRTASVNLVDVMLRSGEYGQVNLPSIPGGDGAGIVAAVGSGVERFEEGDRVLLSGMDREDGGTLAEYAAIPERKVAHLPAEISFEVGGAIGNVGATAWTALEEIAGVQAGDRVLVHGGAGGVGHVAVQIAAASGADVIATAGSDEARERVREFGATTTLEYESGSLADDVLAATGGAGVETILDHRLEEYLELDLQVAAEGGKIVSTMGHIPATSGVPFYMKEVSVQALRMDNRPVRAPVLERIVRLVDRGYLTAAVADTYDFADVEQAHRDAVTGGYVGKLVVTP